VVVFKCIVCLHVHIFFCATVLIFTHNIHTYMKWRQATIEEKKTTYTAEKQLLSSATFSKVLLRPPCQLFACSSFFPFSVFSSFAADFLSCRVRVFACVCVCILVTVFVFFHSIHTCVCVCIHTLTNMRFICFCLAIFTALAVLFVCMCTSMFVCVSLIAVLKKVGYKFSAAISTALIIPLKAIYNP